MNERAKIRDELVLLFRFGFKIYDKFLVVKKVYIVSKRTVN